jgi:hypothetical protein
MTDELSELLTLWAAGQRLTAEQVAEIRANVLASDDAATALDAEWLWRFLRPVTDLLEQAGGSRALRYLMVGDDDAVPFTSYLRLA